MQLVLQAISVFSDKIKKGVQGRSETFAILESKINSNDKTLWFHCASLGEYEQGLPVFKSLKKHYNEHKIILSFFSPSGYEIRKNSPFADVVIYLPIDTPKNAKRFIDLVHPNLTVFVKYDIWPNFLSVLKKKQLKAILISASFRENQSYFKFYGLNLRKALFAFDHIFTQNEASKKLLNNINYKNVTVSGDTRFDRVSDQLNQNNQVTFIEDFKENKVCVVAGSTWPEDENLFIGYINSQASNHVKFIIAPHNIKPHQIESFQNKLKVKSLLYSEKDLKKGDNYQVLIIDCIGLLSKIYSYADIAYIGGAIGTTGLHNTLEPAIFGVPIIIGNNHSKFPEAQAMIDNQGMFAVSNSTEFNTILSNLVNNNESRQFAGKKNAEFINKNIGAVNKILDYLNIG
jgi:3-deoxy-D-manno-octulosonic-acid transferase